MSKLRIASYNILNGGEDRINLLSEVIRDINPDICGILEAVGWDETYKEIFAEKIGFKKFHIGKANSKYNIAIISKVDFEVIDMREHVRHVIVKVLITEGAYNNSVIYFVHLSPINEDDRIKEVQYLLESIDKGSNILIMGDLNSLSPHDSYNKEKLYGMLKKENMVKYGVDQLRFDVVNFLEENNFIDSRIYLKKKFEASVPTPSVKDPHHLYPIRIDYAFAHKDWIKNIKTSDFLKNIKTDKASDHYPIFIDLDK